MKRIVQAIFGALLALQIVNAQEPTANPNTSSPPTITSQPSNATVKLGNKATFSVTASGTAPLSYQWYKWGTAISGATAAQYATPATTDADSGAYFYVTVSNTAGRVTSNNVYLTVNDPPVIDQQPQSLTVNAPALATFTVYVQGTWPMQCQWYRNGVAIKGATDFSYSITETTSVDNGAKFTVTVSNSVGSVTSTPAVLTVNPFNGTGTYPIVGEWSGTATISNSNDDNGTVQVVAGFWQTSYSVAGTFVFVDFNGIPTGGSGIASLNSLNLFMVASMDDEKPANLAGAFSKDLLTFTGQALTPDGLGGSGSLVVSSDHKTLTGSAVLLDGSKISWKMTRTK